MIDKVDHAGRFLPGRNFLVGRGNFLPRSLIVNAGDAEVESCPASERRCAKFPLRIAWWEVLTFATVLFAPWIMMGLLIGCKASADPLPYQVVVRIGFMPNITHAQALLGYQRGDFERVLHEAGYGCQLVTFSSGPSVIEAMYAGHVDVAYIGPSPAINGYVRSDGAEVRVVHGAAENGSVVVGNPRRGVRRMEDLCGKRIAVPQIGNTQDVAAHYFLGTQGTVCARGRNATEIVPVSNADIEILMAKDQLDGAWLPEPWASRLVMSGLGVVVAEEKELWPDGSSPLTVLVARSTFMREHPDTLQRILEVNTALTHELQANGNALVPVLAQALESLTHKRFPTDLLCEGMKRISFTTDIRQAAFMRLSKIARELHYLPARDISLDGLFALPVVPHPTVAPPAAANESF